MENQTAKKSKTKNKYSQIKITFKKRIQNYILFKIKTKEWVQDQRIPSEHAIAKHFECSRLTARNAMQSLVFTGILLSIKGKGYIVSKQANVHLFRSTSEGFQIDTTKIERDEQLRLAYKNSWIEELVAEQEINLNYSFGFKKLYYKKETNDEQKLIVCRLALLNRDVVFHFDKEKIRQSLSTFLIENKVNIDASTEVIIFDNHYIFDEYVRELNWNTNDTYPIILSILKSNNVWVKIDAKIIAKQSFKFTKTRSISRGA